MNQKLVLILSLFLFVILIAFVSCNNPRETSSEPDQSESNEPESQEESENYENTAYNIYVENSGSMKGFFQGKTTLKQVITEYNDRIVGSLNAKVTLNYINTKIEKDNSDLTNYLSQTASRCTASYTRIDSILSMAMNTIRPNEVNLVFSDYCFESPNGDFVTARSGITKIFEMRFREDPSLAVAIMKFDCSFDGYYFPGRIRTKKNLPAYVWVFGPSSLVKRVINLNITIPHETLVLEPYTEYVPKFVNTHARVISKDNKIVVNDWKSDRRDGIYRMNFEINMSKSAIDCGTISNIDNYEVTFIPESGGLNSSSNDGRYYIDAIYPKDDQDTYIFTLCAEDPSPGTVSINLVNDLPQWVISSNFEGTGLPDQGKTLGIKYLIEGVSNAYKNKNINTCSIKVSIKKS